MNDSQLIGDFLLFSSFSLIVSIHKRTNLAIIFMRVMQAQNYIHIGEVMQDL